MKNIVTGTERRDDILMLDIDGTPGTLALMNDGGLKVQWPLRRMRK